MEVLNIRPMTAVKITSLLATAGVLAWSATYVAGLAWHVLATDVNASATEGLVVASSSVTSDTRMVANIDLPRLQSVFTMQAQGQRSDVTLISGTETTAEQTRLSLILQGVVLSSDAAQSRAIIGGGDVQQGYKPGDSIVGMPGNVVLQAVYQRYVLLDNNGRTETLRMDEMASDSAITTAQVMTGFAENPTLANSAVPSASAKFAGLMFSDLVRIQPVFEPSDGANAGALRGIQIRHGSRQDFLSAAGLQQGDLITGVNGKAIHDPAQLPQLVQQISDSQTVALQVLRDEQLLSVQLDRTHW